MKSIWTNFGAICGSLVIGLSSAQAVSLVPASSIALPSEAEPVGASLVTSSVLNFSSLTFSGTLTSKVWSGDTSNPFGGLTFTYQISNDAVSADPIDRLTLSSYAGFQTDASYFGAGIVPTSAVRNPAGNQVTFDFAGQFQGTLVAGSTSPLLILQTDSAAFQVSNAAVINSSSVNVATFAPLAVPEPTAAVIFVAGAIIFGLRRKS